MRYLVFVLLGTLILSGCGTRENKRQEHIASALESETYASTEQVSHSEESETESDKEKEVSGAVSAESLIGTIDWDRENVYLPELQMLLDDNHIKYAIKQNVTGERLDVLCEDGMKLILMEASDEEGHIFGHEVIMYQGRFNDNGFGEDYLHEYDVTTDEYYYPTSDREFMDPIKFNDMTQTDLSIARNEIYARHGRRFQDEFLNAVFCRKSWYQPRYDGEEFAKLQDGLLSEVEQVNLKAIAAYETERGYRQQTGHTGLERVLSGSWLDLYGDGNLVQVTYETTTKDGVDRMVLNAETFSEEIVSMYLDDVLYTGNPDGTRTLLFVQNIADGGTRWMTVYCLTANGLVDMGAVSNDGGEVSIKEGHLYGLDTLDHMQTFYGELEYEIEGDVLKPVTKEYYEQGNDVTVLLDVPVYRKKDVNSPVFLMAKGDVVTILGSDLKHWVELKDKRTGETGWMYVQEMECTLPDGRVLDSYKIFDGLQFWG